MSKLDKTTEDYVIRVVSKAVAKRKRQAKLDKEYLEKISRKRKMVKKLTKSASAKKVFKKAAAKKTIGKSIAKKIPYVGAVLTAAEIAKMVKNRKAKPVKGKSCGPGKTKVTTGGKTYCVSGKKKFKAGKPVKDPISKR